MLRTTRLLPWFVALVPACASSPSPPDDAAAPRDALATDAPPPIDAPRADDAPVSPDVPAPLDVPAPPDGGAPARLRVSHRDILAPDGTPIQLRGYSWGAWGTAQTGDGDANRMQGANVVRIPLRWWGHYHPGVDSYDLGAEGHIDLAHLGVLDDMIDQATRAHLWVVLFLDSDSGQGAENNYTTGAIDDFWSDPTMRARFAEAWEFLVRRYRGREYIGAYELLPEPQHRHADGTYGPDVDAEVRTFYESLVPRVRALDARTPLIVGPNEAYNSNRLEAAYTTVDPNVIYTVDYFLFNSPASGHLADLMAFQSAHDVPVWINQIGIESGRPMADVYARAALGALNEHAIGWAWWTYRIDSTNPDVHGIYYLGADGMTWIPKPTWLALVGSYFH